VYSREDISDAQTSIQAGISALSDWGASWRILFEPTKSQCMTISHHRPPWQFPGLTFDGITISNVSELKLLGVTFDGALTYRQQVRALATRANQRLGLLQRASSILDNAGRARVYKAFVRPVMEYCSLAWMGAAPTQLRRLDRIQGRALRMIGDGCWLESLQHRRNVAACTFLYKLLTLPDDSPLKTMLPPPPLRRPASTQPTRSSHRQQQLHHLQLATTLQRTDRDSLARSFPAYIVPIWNQLPASLLDVRPHPKGMQSFKCGVHRFLLRNDWQAAIDVAHPQMPHSV